MTAAKKNKETEDELSQANANDLAISMSTILNNSMHHYWLSSSDEKVAMDEAYETLCRSLEECSSITLSIYENLLRANEIIVDNNNPNVRVYVEHLQALNIDNFTLNKNISEEDFFKVIEIIDAQPFELEQLGGFKKLLADFDIKNVEAKIIKYKQVAEDETIIAASEAENMKEGNGVGEAKVANILAFLKGDVTTDDPDALKEVHDVATNANKMAELVMRAAEIQHQSAPIEEGESLVDFVVGCMKRTYQGLKKDKSYKTKIGKKRITKNLLLLEEEIITRMREMSMPRASIRLSHSTSIRSKTP